MQSRFLTLISALVFSFSAHALDPKTSSSESSNMMDELDPNAPNIEELLESYDLDYEQQTGKPAQIFSPLSTPLDDCYRQTCPVWVQVVKSTQLLYLYIDGVHTYTWKVSTGVNGGTPNFDTHPNGRIYDRYTSTKFPGGDYKGLGNMPYAVFINGGFAVHGTGAGNWSKLGRAVSHGCVRIHPDNALIFNRMVREVGINKVWITVQ